MLLAAQFRDAPTQGTRHRLGGAGVPFLEALLVHIEVGVADEEARDLVTGASAAEELRTERFGEGLRPRLRTSWILFESARE